MDLSVVVCTHNRARLLALCLDRLAAQRVEAGTAWEAIVVDNNSADGTAETVERERVRGRIPGLRLVGEARQGVAFARRRGIAEARGRLVAFVDDDCLLEPGWIAAALDFARAHPAAGAFGGRNQIAWEEPPSALASLYGESLAAQDWGDEPFRLPMSGRRCPVGAGLVVDRDAARASGWSERGRLTGRCGGALHAGEDAELVMFVRHAGFEIWYAPALVLDHVIGRERTTLAHLRGIHRGFGRAEPYLRVLARTHAPRFADRLATALWALGEMMRVLARWPRGYLQFAEERPTWLIRLSYVQGCLAGAARFLAGRV
ncbi:MAG: glycosyltransferase family 2 protein [Candidatus Odyssella sp.]|nr:glycosyltransferase family 2 protein [Candidatus Odyssella sp.]